MTSRSSRGDHFWFGLIFIKKNNQTEFFFLKKKPKPGQTDRFQFGSVFLGKKPVQTGLTRFFRFWLGFFQVFCRFRFGSVFFCFLFIKPKPNRTGRFFQNFNRFNRFFGSVFSVFFSGFLGLISFSVFLLTPIFLLQLVSE